LWRTKRSTPNPLTIVEVVFVERYATLVNLDA
jgi:hypothetical protein